MCLSDAEQGGKTVLMYSTFENATASVAGVLLASGASVNAVDQVGCKSALMYSAENGNVAVTQGLLGAGADVNASDCVVRCLCGVGVGVGLQCCEDDGALCTCG